MDQFNSVLETLRGSNLAATAFRLFLAMLFGGIIGIERGRRHRPAGFRTHILVCMGAALAMCISQYLYITLGQSTDISRLGAQCINGIGFLGAGTIIVTGHQQVKGLTTAAGLWASACMGLAIGAGYYECAILACITIFFTITVLNNLEKMLTSRTKNMNVEITLTAVAHLPEVLDEIRGMDIKIFDFEITNVRDLKVAPPNVIIEMKLPHVRPHAEVITTLAAIDGVLSVEEP